MKQFSLGIVPDTFRREFAMVKKIAELGLGMTMSNHQFIKMMMDEVKPALFERGKKSELFRYMQSEKGVYMPDEKDFPKMPEESDEPPEFDDEAYEAEQNKPLLDD